MDNSNISVDKFSTGSAGDHPHEFFFLNSDFETLDDALHHQPVKEVFPRCTLAIGQVVLSDRGVAPLGGAALVFRITKLIFDNYHRRSL